MAPRGMRTPKAQLQHPQPQGAAFLMLHFHLPLAYPLLCFLSELIPCESMTHLGVAHSAATMGQGGDPQAKAVWHD